MTNLLHCFVFCLLWLPLLTADLECYSCTNVTSTKTCNTKITCSQGEKCYTSATGIGSSQKFELGCKSEKECLPVGGIGIVGRSVVSSTDCLQCCQVDNCNRNLCSSGIPVISEVGVCADDPTFDCAGVSSVFNICTDVHHAKVKCRKYCGLCNLVDGSWSPWSSWSKCDVTCSSGHMSRARTCSDPAPAHGGLDCAGDVTETKPCVLDRCPVHGGWSSWSSWGYCSVTCGVGLQRRDRTCSNPYPGPNGDHCFGDSRDDRPCFVQACSDGLWSAWSDWGPCSGTCSGLQKRNRTCNNPAPSNFGHVCIGNDEEYQPCDKKNCSEAVAFRATTLSNTYLHTRTETAVFTNTVLNEGNGYNDTTGEFTAPSSGVYLFIVQICSSGSYTGYVNIMIDNRTEFKENIQGSVCHSFTVFTSLTTGNKVWVTLSASSSRGLSLAQGSGYTNMFQGMKLDV